MSDPQLETVALLREIRDNQQQQLQTQARALALQTEHFEMAKRQLDRAERINDKAEALQARGAGAIKIVLGVLALAVLALLVLILPPLLRMF